MEAPAGTIGPLCEYFYNYEIPTCLHGSCLRIADETDPVYPNEFEGGEHGPQS